MINHVRTLLLASPGSQAYPTLYPGEEYVPRDYTPPALSSQLDVLRRSLLGEGDRALRNLRLRQLLQLIHAGRLAEDIRRHDTRLSYYPFDRDDFFRHWLQGPVPVALATAATASVEGYWQLRSDQRLYHAYRVEVLPGNEVQMDYTDDAGVPQQQTVSYAAAASVQVALPNLDARLLFENTSGAVWSVILVLRPLTSFVQVVRTALAAVDDAVENVLFGRGGEAYYDVYRNVYRQSPDLCERVAAVALALTERIEEARRG